MSRSSRPSRSSRSSRSGRYRIRTAATATALAAALLAAAVPADADTPATVGTPAAAPKAAQNLTVDLAASEGPVLHGANGTLYGLSDDGVPSDAALAPLKLTSVSQKPEGGAPAPQRRRAHRLQVVLPQRRRRRPGDDAGHLRQVAVRGPRHRRLPHQGRQDRQGGRRPHPNSERFVYVPFNEPDQIWYNLGIADQAQYEVQPRPVLQGLEDGLRADPRHRPGRPDRRARTSPAYHTRLLRDFLAFAKQENVLPQVTTWHELRPGSLRDFQGHYDHYRALEKELGHRAAARSTSTSTPTAATCPCPGQLVQWVSMFERNKVYANQAYWDAAGNLSGNVVAVQHPQRRLVVLPLVRRA